MKTFDVLPFYPDDFLRSPTVKSLNSHEVGAYMLLLCEAWIGDPPGYLPDDEKYLKRITRLSDIRFRTFWAKIKSKFPPSQESPALLYNPRLLYEYQKLEARRNKQIEGARRGGKKGKRNRSNSQNLRQFLPSENLRKNGELPQGTLDLRNESYIITTNEPVRGWKDKVTCEMEFNDCENLEDKLRLPQGTIEKNEKIEERARDARTGVGVGRYLYNKYINISHPPLNPPTTTTTNPIPNSDKTTDKTVLENEKESADIASAYPQPAEPENAAIAIAQQPRNKPEVKGTARAYLRKRISQLLLDRGQIVREEDVESYVDMIGEYGINPVEKVIRKETATKGKELSIHRVKYVCNVDMKARQAKKEQKKSIKVDNPASLTEEPYTPEMIERIIQDRSVKDEFNNYIATQVNAESVYSQKGFQSTLIRNLFTRWHYERKKDKK